MNAASVLIYEPNDGAAEALCALLSREGLRPLITAEVEDLQPLYNLHKPSLLLLDADQATVRDVEILLALCESAALNDAPIVVLGTRRGKSPLSQVGEFVRKPYHYGPLVHRISDAVAGQRVVSSRAA